MGFPMCIARARSSIRGGMLIGIPGRGLIASHPRATMSVLTFSSDAKMILTFQSYSISNPSDSYFLKHGQNFQKGCPTFQKSPPSLPDGLTAQSHRKSRERFKLESTNCLLLRCALCSGIRNPANLHICKAHHMSQR